MHAEHTPNERLSNYSKTVGKVKDQYSWPLSAQLSRNRVAFIKVEGRKGHTSIALEKCDY